MFSSKVQVSLFVDDVKKAIEFWQSLDFELIDAQETDGTLVAEIAPNKNAGTHFMIYDRNFIEKQSPEVATNPPQVMFFSENIIELYKKMQALPIEIGELIQLEETLVFNFIDPDGNFFAVSES
ncbi:VOC family protein [Tetragenococcus solitarius]|uniref:Lactoylglutathione lyase n=1 Tax=Tetragenococcus solitarius TaxID=71453 RepID=A0ABN3Y8F0_9ENTE|nr:VOC family protein [Tetragenococcus solitarius]